jgi:tetratricopeptide (TPR) repeat protein
MEGSVRKAGNRVRITGQLIDTASNAHIWADKFDGLLDDIFELQDKVASTAVGAIEPKLMSAEMQRVRRKPTESIDAYDFYLRALAQFHEYTRETTAETNRFVRCALGVDPCYAPAAALFGWCNCVRTTRGWITASKDDIAEILRLAQQAIVLGHDDPDALWMSGYTVSFFAGNHTLALNTIDRALALNPNSAHCWMAWGMVSVFMNAPEAAIAALETAIRLSPFDPLGSSAKFGLGFAYFNLGRYEDAIGWAERAVADEPRHSSSLRIAAAACALLGREEEAREWAGRLIDLEPNFTIEQFRSRAKTFNSTASTIALVEGLRQAGLPEH